MKQFSNLLFVFVTALVSMKAVGNEINTIPADIMTTIGSQVEKALSLIPKKKHAEFMAKVDDHLKEYSHIQIAAQRGDVKSQFELGRMFESGYMDYDSAFYWYKRAASNGHTGAMFYIGRLYERDKIESSNDDKGAIYWYLLSANQGNKFAQRHVAGLYFHGKVVVRNYYESYVWYSIVTAQNYLGGARDRMDEIEQKVPAKEILSAQKVAAQKILDILLARD